MYGPIYPTKPSYQGMTTLPREVEEALLSVPYGNLITFLRRKTVISGTDSIYGAVQEIAKAFIESEIKRFLDQVEKEPPAPLPTRVKASEVLEKSKEHAAERKHTLFKQHQNVNAHQQSEIDAKKAIAKELGGSIEFQRAGGSKWKVQMPNGEEHFWTAEFFRDHTQEQIRAIFEAHK